MWHSFSQELCLLQWWSPNPGPRTRTVPWPIRDQAHIAGEWGMSEKLHLYLQPHPSISISPDPRMIRILLIGIFMSLLMKVTKISDLSPYFKFFFCFTHFLDMLKIFNLILFPTLTAQQMLRIKCSHKLRKMFCTHGTSSIVFSFKAVQLISDILQVNISITAPCYHKAGN